MLPAATGEKRIFLHGYIWTGARRSEIFRWSWSEDANFERKEYRLGTRKTRDGSMEYEWFPMPAELCDGLWGWWEKRPMEESPYVFTMRTQGPAMENPIFTATDG